EVYRALMSIADDRKTLTDGDIRSVMAAIRAEHITVPHDAVDPFDTPSAAAVHHVMHESGYGHGVYSTLRGPGSRCPVPGVPRSELPGSGPAFSTYTCIVGRGISMPCSLKACVSRRRS